MGKKYIIELCEKPMKNENGNDIWRVKGFNTLVFDQNGLDKLEECIEPEREIKVGDLYLYDNSKYVMVTKPVLNEKRIYCIFEDGTPQVYGLDHFKKNSVFVHDHLSFDDFLDVWNKGERSF